MTGLLDSSAETMCQPLADRLGGKAATLVELQSAGFRVPEFVVSPEDLDATIERLGTPLAVRSSACGEDGIDHSFAGQFCSFLNLHSVDEVSDAVARCRASIRQPSVLDYCHRQGVDPNSLRMEVIVQRMINPEIAGVVFTINPVTGVEEFVVEACEGLADEMLSGRQDALAEDHPELEKHRDAIESIARRVQRHFGSPQDIEFAIEAGEIFILQSRPITRIGFSAEVGQWTNADFRDGGVSSTVCSPLMWSLYELVWNRSLKSTLADLKLLDGDFVASKMFFGRPYWNLEAVKNCVAVLPGFKEREFDQDLSVQINYDGDGRTTPITLMGIIRAIPTVLAVKEFLRSQQDAAQQLLDTPIQDRLRRYVSESTDIEQSFRTLIENEYIEIESTYFRTIFAASLAKMDFMSSFPDADYGSLVAALPPLSHVEPVRVVQSLRRRSPSDIDRVIDKYRHHYRLGLDLIHPRWDEDRPFVAKMLTELPDSIGSDPAPVYESARATMLSRLPRRKHRRFDRKLERLRHFLWLREQLRDVSSYLYYAIRRCAVELAAKRGLGQAIFFQTYREVFADTRDNIDRNLEIYDSYRNFRAPGEIGTGFRFERGTHSGELQGIGASPGTCSGQAFIARSVQHASQMPRGCILVCPFTDPGWTAVLDRAAGVVTETGGLLSHAAILCREYGIPAVLGVDGATERIRDGSNIVVDGSAGCVCLASPPKEF